MMMMMISKTLPNEIYTYISSSFYLEIGIFCFYIVGQPRSLQSLSEPLVVVGKSVQLCHHHSTLICVKNSLILAYIQLAPRQHASSAFTAFSYLPTATLITQYLSVQGLYYLLTCFTCLTTIFPQSSELPFDSLFILSTLKNPSRKKWTLVAESEMNLDHQAVFLVSV